jgi:hypothetical protein
MPLNRHYNQHYLTNDGEFALDRLFDLEFHYHKDQWDIFHSFRLAEHLRNKNERGECDFIIVHKKGVVVLECKGGSIKYENKTFYSKSRQSDNLWEPFSGDPYMQLDGNKGTLVRQLQENNTNPFVTGCLVFPETSFDYKVDLKDLWHHGKNQSLLEYLLELLEDKPEQLKTSEVTKITFDKLKGIFAPSVMPEEHKTNLIKSKAAADLRTVDNLKILQGLNENKRIMIEGPPGSGKAKYAKELIKLKIKQGAKAVLYVCWNELLAAHSKSFFDQDELLKPYIKVCSFYELAREIISASGIKPEGINFEDLRNNKLLRNALNAIKQKNDLPLYDLIVADEAQDLFVKGLFDIIDNCLCSGKSGIEKGSYLIFWDQLDPFSEAENLDEYNTVRDLLKEYAAVYTLSPTFRAVSGHGITELLEAVQSGSFSLQKNYGTDVIIKTYSDITEIPEKLKNLCHSLLHDTKCSKEEMIVLITSNLISGNRPQSKPLDDKLDHQVFEKLTLSNIGEPASKFRYTTCLSYKGIDNDIVVLIVNELFNEKIKNIYQLLLGASRARAKLFLLIDKTSMEENLNRTS